MNSIKLAGKIICIGGYSGSGKSTAIGHMRRYMSNTAFITSRGDIRTIHDPQKLEEEFGIPVDTNHIFDYFKKVICLNAGIDELSFYENLTYQKMFSKLISDYIEKQYEQACSEILRSDTPDFIIMEWSTIPSFKIWMSSDYRVMIQPINMELLYSNLIRRSYQNRRKLTLDAAKMRNLSIMDIVENANNVTIQLINDYSSAYEQAVKKFCFGLMRT